jgi:hypothetical protein
LLPYIEMERQMGLPDHYTYVPGVPESVERASEDRAVPTSAREMLALRVVSRRLFSIFGKLVIALGSITPVIGMA